MSIIRCRIILLDGEECFFDMKLSSFGVELFDSVCNHIGLDEKDYFSLKFIHPKDNQYSWLDFRKTLEHQLKEGPYLFEFNVRFYPPDPTVLNGDLTRYLFILQIRYLLINEKLICKVDDQPILAAFLLQAEFGDSDEVRFEEIQDMIFFPNQTTHLIEKTVEYHKQLTGLTPSEVEFKFLDYCKKFGFYGLEIYEVYDCMINEIRQLAISPYGIYVLNEVKQVTKVSWPQIIEISFNNKAVLLKCHKNNENQIQTLTWRCRSRVDVKRIYGSMIDTHTFFRRSIPPPPLVSSFKIGSRHSYSGRKTFKQSISSAYSNTAGGNGLGNEFKRVSSTRFSTNTINRTFKTNKTNDSLKIPEYNSEKKVYETQRLDITISDESSILDSFDNTIEHKFILQTKNKINLNHTLPNDCSEVDCGIMSSTPTKFC